MIYPTRLPFRDLLTLVRELALNQGQVLNLADLQRKIGSNIRTVQNILYALEGLFLIRTMSVEGSGKGQAVFFEDPAESNYLGEGEIQKATTIEHLCFLFLRSNFSYRPGLDFQFFQFRTRGGVVVPIAIRSGDYVTGCIPIEEEIPNRIETSAARSFLSTYASAKILFVSSQERTRKRLDDRRLVIPITDLL